jgi:hypothetical protein
MKNILILSSLNDPEPEDRLRIDQKGIGGKKEEMRQ